MECFVFNICAPNLEYLSLVGNFTEVCLGNTPLLIEMSLDMYENEDIFEHFEFRSSSNLIKVLGGVPLLGRLTGSGYFTKYLSIGNLSGSIPMKVNNLKTIKLDDMNFNETKEILVVIRLVTHSPNLKELHLVGSNETASPEEPDLDFLDVECPLNCKFEKLRVIYMGDISGFRHEIEFTNFLLCRSPVLETMTIHPCDYVTNVQLDMLMELVRFKSASPQAKIILGKLKHPV